MNYKLILPKLIPELVFLSLIFFLTVVPMRDFDIWFHIKSGEIITKMGLIHKDVFSFTALGREWAPYEWLFQVISYYIQQVFGFDSIKYFMAGIITFQAAIFVLLFRKIFRLNLLISFALSFIFISSVYEFFTARPHVVAYTFLMTNLALIFNYYFRGKNLLFLSLPVTFFWANLHGSIFLDVVFFVSYSIIAFINFYLTKEKEWLKKAKILGIFGFITTVLTILPPLGITQYQLLWKFFLLRNFISSYIDEWTPLNSNPASFYEYTLTALIISLLFASTIFIKHNFQKSIWILPLLPFLVMPYMANRNVYLAYITLILMLGWILSSINFLKGKTAIKYIVIGSLAILVALSGWQYYLKKNFMSGMRFYYPVHATEFIKNYNLKGNMFNEYGYGGYLLYHLYPDHKVFIDGRTEMYLCCEMPDTLELSTKKYLPDSEYKIFLDSLWNKYDISYVLLRTQKHTVLRKMTEILTNDPSWNLVFWDDHTQLFVRRDGKNEAIFKQFETKAATPYSKNPYRDGMEKEAFFEYQKMIQVTDSAKSRNSLGFLLLKQGKLEEAEQQFLKATIIDPTNESPFMNLAEIAANKNEIEQAIAFYEKALMLADDRGLIYIRLGQLYIISRNDFDAAKIIWQRGLEKTIDTESKKQLEQLLSSI